MSNSRTYLILSMILVLWNLNHFIKDPQIFHETLFKIIWKRKGIIYKYLDYEYLQLQSNINVTKSSILSRSNQPSELSIMPDILEIQIFSD